MNSKRHTTLAVLALVFISLVLRPPIAAVGPLLHSISGELQLNAASTSLLASVPVFCFGLGAFLSPWLMRRFGLNHVMFVTLIVMAVAIVSRVWFGYSILLLATVLVGLSIAVANVLLPTFVRSDFTDRASIFTSIYTTLLAIAASFSAAFAVQWADLLGDWRLAMLTPALPLFVAIALWWPRVREAEPHLPIAGHAAKAESRAVYRSPVAWAILLFFGIQSLGFYALLGWLPTMLISIGVDPASAGSFLGLATAIGIPSGFALAPLIARLKSLSTLAAIASLSTTAGFAFLAVIIGAHDPTNSAAIIFAGILISVGQTATFPMSLSLIATRASSRAQTTMLSAFAQGWGYLISGVATFAVGAIGASVSWKAAVVVLVVLSAIQVAIGFYAGRNTHIPAA
ncbi:MAG: MFS transporter [Micrococcales bacterium]